MCARWPCMEFMEMYCVCENDYSCIRRQVLNEHSKTLRIQNTYTLLYCMLTIRNCNYMIDVVYQWSDNKLYDDKIYSYSMKWNITVCNINTIRIITLILFFITCIIEYINAYNGMRRRRTKDGTTLYMADCSYIQMRHTHAAHTKIIVKRSSRMYYRLNFNRVR